MKAIPLRMHQDYIPSNVPPGVPCEILLKEIDEDDGEWYLLEIESDEKYRAYDSDREFAAGRIKRPFISPKYKGTDKHNCAWVRQKYCKELEAENNRDALGMLRRD